MTDSSCSTSSGLPETPHQPLSFQYPKRSFEKKVTVNRSFQPSWYARWSWLHYLENQDAVLCLICAQASYLKKIQWSCNLDLSFISKGFSNWKDATNKFQRHAVSKTHKEAVLKMLTLSSSVNIAESLSSEHKREKYERRQCLLK